MDVQFGDEENQREIYQFKSKAVLGDSRTPHMARWLVKTGIVKSEKSAGTLMLLITIACFIAAGIILWSLF
ncbi:MAG: hypothetical protein A2664_02120 [Candidatus Taylorbacteria bacterium RIFCSPHIGHO2_01_FULL_46_22b]|uniref:Uncharacterized protein n=1 Tax=Candidatus Taylorbacteria bacterium RIFCSPHIGHO2_01_FULL_46_22b TaxID=1802301 RepID=A0A1G2M348_9BACT|nr:MAG: hypothetical protein A2664_02120 [Candidatus Taylorbacteria bacterium RIFCSPHIGHO2_01_FULL_46_22b]